MSYDGWGENFHGDAARGFRWSVVLAFFAVLLVVAVGLMWTFGFGLFQRETAAFRGETGAIERRESAENRVAAQERFEDLYAEIVATDRKLAPAEEALEADPDSQVRRTEFTGLTNYCLDVVGDYNAEARKYTAADFRAADLPAEIDGTDPATDCRP
jgi:hypothetical protein